MKVLIVGSGGREHALTWAASRSPLVTTVYAAPGNAGTSLEPKTTNIAIPAEDIDSLVGFALETGIDLTIVGPEVPLTMGIVDLFRSNRLQCFGPCANAAQLEGSKNFTKQFLSRQGIPTADFDTFDEVEAAFDFVKDIGLPAVIKADGLAAGKGVVIVETLEHARSTLTDMLLEKKYGNAGETVVVERFIQGEEASYICMVDGEDIVPMATSQDHKAACDADTGPNTGGMGAYSPAPVIDPEMEQRVLNEIIRPTVRGLAKENIRYTGFLYAGLMIDEKSDPYVLEFNCRLGDPETQPILLRLKSDLIELICAALSRNLNTVQVEWTPKAALGVVVAAKGYPNSYSKGGIISGLNFEDLEDVKVFHAGTKHDSENNVVVNGGRVVCVTALGDDIERAQGLAYRSVSRIHMSDKHYRTDIGSKAINRNNHC